MVGDDPAGRFCAKASALASTVEQVPAAADVPAAVTRYLDAAGLGRCAVGAADLATFDWAAAGLAVCLAGAVDADTVGLTGSFCAIAETGTLVLLSGPRTLQPASGLLPENPRPSSLPTASWPPWKTPCCAGRRGDSCLNLISAVLKTSATSSRPSSFRRPTSAAESIWWWWPDRHLRMALAGGQVGLPQSVRKGRRRWRRLVAVKPGR